MTPPPKRGGTYLYCPRCTRRRTRILRAYTRHFARVHASAALTSCGQALAVASAATAPGAPVITHYAMGGPLPGVGPFPQRTRVTQDAPWAQPAADVLRDVIRGLREL